MYAPCEAIDHCVREVVGLGCLAQEAKASHLDLPGLVHALIGLKLGLGWIGVKQGIVHIANLHYGSLFDDANSDLPFFDEALLLQGCYEGWPVVWEVEAESQVAPSNVVEVNVAADRLHGEEFVLREADLWHLGVVAGRPVRLVGLVGWRNHRKCAESVLSDEAGEGYGIVLSAEDDLVHDVIRLFEGGRCVIVIGLCGTVRAVGRHHIGPVLLHAEDEVRLGRLAPDRERGRVVACDACPNDHALGFVPLPDPTEARRKPEPKKERTG